MTPLLEELTLEFSLIVTVNPREAGSPSTWPWEDFFASVGGAKLYDIAFRILEPQAEELN